VDIFDGESYGHDYGSYGHEAGDRLWWYEHGVHIADGEEYHHYVLGDSDDKEDDDDDHEIAENFIRGRYSPVNERISLIPALMDDCFTMDYDIPREVFRELEDTFPEAVEIEIF